MVSDVDLTIQNFKFHTHERNSRFFCLYSHNPLIHVSQVGNVEEVGGRKGLAQLDEHCEEIINFQLSIITCFSLMSLSE